MNKYLIIFITCLISSATQAMTFEDFKRMKQAEFVQYKKVIAEEFAAYKRIYHEEVENNKKQIKQNWNEAQISDKKTWVEYSKDKRTRRMVDYENGFIELSIQTEKTGSALEQKIRTEMKDLLIEDKKTAFNRDTVAKNVEKRIKKSARLVQSASIPKEAILMPIFIAQKKPTQTQINQTVEKWAIKAKRKMSLEKGRKTVKISIKIPQKGLQRKAMALKPVVYQYAKKEQIKPALIYAVIHTESAFNPMARSHVPAYGLMQIVPRSAGKDSSDYLFGKPQLLAPSYLYDSSKNIEIGAAYLHLLYYKYLKKISHPISRLYCTIAAYNTGAGNVARAFTGKTNVNHAATKINPMTPEQVYQHLENNLPHQETQDYIRRVRKRIKLYN